MRQNAAPCNRKTGVALHGGFHRYGAGLHGIAERCRGNWGCLGIWICRRHSPHSGPSGNPYHSPPVPTPFLSIVGLPRSRQIVRGHAGKTAWDRLGEMGRESKISCQKSAPQIGRSVNLGRNRKKWEWTGKIPSRFSREGARCPFEGHHLFDGRAEFPVLLPNLASRV